jgi:hypothetical protein
MRFINQFTPKDINYWCTKGTVRITFSVVEPEAEEIVYRDEKRDGNIRDNSKGR